MNADRARRLLGLSKDGALPSVDDLHKAFRAKVLEHHPDARGGRTSGVTVDELRAGLQYLLQQHKEDNKQDDRDKQQKRFDEAVKEFQARAKSTAQAEYHYPSNHNQSTSSSSNNNNSEYQRIIHGRPTEPVSDEDLQQRLKKRSIPITNTSDAMFTTLTSGIVLGGLLTILLLFKTR
jgi:hypothetical protein